MRLTDKLMADLEFLHTIRPLRLDRMNTGTQNTPALTPAVGSGIGFGLALAYLTHTDSSQWVRLTGIVCSALVLCVAAVCEHGIRRSRNETEQVRISAAAEPDTIITHHDPEDHAS